MAETTIAVLHAVPFQDDMQYDSTMTLVVKKDLKLASDYASKVLLSSFLSLGVVLYVGTSWSEQSLSASTRNHWFVRRRDRRTYWHHSVP